MRKHLGILLFPLFLVPAMLSAEPVTWYSLQNLTQASGPQELSVIDQSTEKITNLLQHGVLFTYKDRSASHMYIAGNFSNWRTIPMHKGNNGVWFYFLPNDERRSAVEYKFKRNNIWLFDPMNSNRQSDGKGSFVSRVDTQNSTEGTRVTWRIVRDKGTDWIEFRTWNPGARFISVVGDFNNWNPEHNVLRKGSDDIWRTRVHVPNGTYRYKFVVDGKWVADIYNPQSASDNTGEVCSLLNIR